MLGLFFIHFCLPEISVNTVLQQMNRKTDPTGIQCWDSNSRALDGHFPPVGNHSLLVEWLLDMRGANLWTKFRSRVTTNRCDWMFQIRWWILTRVQYFRIVKLLYSETCLLDWLPADAHLLNSLWICYHMNFLCHIFTCIFKFFYLYRTVKGFV